MAEIVRPRHGEPVELGPCPSWCALGDRHFSEDEPPPFDATDGFHHYGPEIMVTTAYRARLDGPKPVVRLLLQSFAGELDGEPGPARIEIELTGTADPSDMSVQLSPDDARMLAASLIGLADIASRS
jgi:hypothetical protein